MAIGKWEMKPYDSGIDYENGVMNCRQVGDRKFQFIEVIGLRSCTGDKDAPPFSVEVKYIDLDKIPEKEMASALRSCGWEGMKENDDRVLAECLVQYGLSARIWEGSGSNRLALLAQAYGQARANLPDTEEFKIAMGKPVNAIGSTAEEYMKGDVYTALSRASPDDQTASIMKQMCKAATATCPSCHGKGKATDPATKIYLDSPCSTCEGKGQVMQTLGGIVPAPVHKEV